MNLNTNITGREKKNYEADEKQERKYHLFRFSTFRNQPSTLRTHKRDHSALLGGRLVTEDSNLPRASHQLFEDVMLLDPLAREQLVNLLVNPQPFGYLSNDPQNLIELQYFSESLMNPTGQKKVQSPGHSRNLSAPTKEKSNKQLRPSAVTQTAFLSRHQELQDIRDDRFGRLASSASYVLTEEETSIHDEEEAESHKGSLVSGPLQISPTSASFPPSSIYIASSTSSSISSASLAAVKEIEKRLIDKSATITAAAQILPSLETTETPTESPLQASRGVAENADASSVDIHIQLNGERMNMDTASTDRHGGGMNSTELEAVVARLSASHQLGDTANYDDHCDDDDDDEDDDPPPV